LVVEFGRLSGTQYIFWPSNFQKGSSTSSPQDLVTITDNKGKKILLGSGTIEGRPMGFGEFELRYIEDIVGKLCKRRSPSHLRNQLRAVYVVGEHEVTVYEERPSWDNPREWTASGIAKFRYSRKQNLWRLYWMGQNLKWYPYVPLPESMRIDRLVIEVDKDPYDAFCRKSANDPKECIDQESRIRFITS
jgi:hypothetical protein